MSTLRMDSTSAAGTTDTQRHSTLAHGDNRLQQRTTANTMEPDLTTSSSLADDYGVKSMDDLLPSSKPVENISSPTLTTTTINTDDNNDIPTYTTTSNSTSTGTLTQHPSDTQQQHGAVAVIPKDDHNSDKSMDQDDTSNNTSTYGDYYYDEDDDTFSCLTGDASQPCFYGHANDSTATWQSGLSDSNIDLVVPKVNIRPGKLQHHKPPNQFIGSLSIMVCGDSGIGKSSLIQAFSLMPETIGGRLYTGLEANSLDDAEKYANGDNLVLDISAEKNISGEIKEYYASTTTQSKQAGTLDKNICFIDTPGYGAFVDAKAVIRSTTKYLERQFQQTNDMLSPTQPSTPKLARLLHNIHGGHSHVDVCLYLILDRIKPVDIEYLRSIQQLCNIIPVIVKSDLLSSDQEQTLKRKILQDLHDNNVEFYHCGYSFEQLLEFGQQQQQPDDGGGNAFGVPPFCISTKLVTNKHHHQTRTAKGYLKLLHLKDALFYKHIDSLRQSTVTKFIQWRREQTNIQQAYRTQRRHSPSSTTSAVTSSFTTASLSSSSAKYNKQQNSGRSSSSSSKTLSSSLSMDHHLTVMLDLETLTQKLAAREIAERVQDLASKQRRSINLHMVNYITDQRQRLELQKQERLYQLQQKYHVMTQQEKVKFLTSQLNGVLSEFGLLVPGGTLQKKETPNFPPSSSSSSSSVWHIYPPPDVLDQLVVFQNTPVYLMVGLVLIILFISGFSKWWWSL